MDLPMKAFPITASIEIFADLCSLL